MNGSRTEITIKRSDFEQMTSDLVAKTMGYIDNALDKVPADSIDTVLLVGGSTYMPMIINEVEAKFPGKVQQHDPDQAVARGAAVYHYFLHKYDKEIEDEVIDTSPAQIQKSFAPEKKPVKNITAAGRAIGVDWGRSVINESFYLVLSGGNYEEIIPAGKELPYTSKRFTGFRLPPGKNVIGVPIARCEMDGSYRIIAKGTITFPEKYSRTKEDTFVTFSIFMNEDKIIRMDAATCQDSGGLDLLHYGTVTISIAKGVERGLKNKLIARSGSYVNPKNQINAVRSFCKRYDDAFRKHNQLDQKKFAATLRLHVDTILSAANHKDFAEPLLQTFDDVKYSTEETFKERCVVIARKIGAKWTLQQKRRLAQLCLNQLDDEIYNPGINLGAPQGWKMNTKIQCVYTLSICGGDNDIALLVNLHGNPKLRQACLYTHAITKTQIEWIYSEFKKDFNKVLLGSANSAIQISAHALGVAFKLDGRPNNSKINRDEVVADLCKVIRSQNLNNVELSVCILAIGLLCDRRIANVIDQKALGAVDNLFNDLPALYAVNNFAKAMGVAQKMIQGNELTPEEEESLLMKWAT